MRRKEEMLSEKLVTAETKNADIRSRLVHLVWTQKAKANRGKAPPAEDPTPVQKPQPHRQKTHKALQTSLLDNPVVLQTMTALEEGGNVDDTTLVVVFTSLQNHIDERSVREMRSYAHPPEIVQKVMMASVSMAKGVICKEFKEAKKLATSSLLKDIMGCDYHDLPGDSDFGLLKAVVKLVFATKLPPPGTRWKFKGIGDLVKKTEGASAAAATLLVWTFLVSNLAHRELGDDHDTAIDLSEMVQASEESKDGRDTTTKNATGWENSNAVSRAGFFTGAPTPPNAVP